MTHQLTITLTEMETQLLRKYAAFDCRRPQEQARYLLRTVLFAMEKDMEKENLIEQTRSWQANVVGDLYTEQEAFNRLFVTRTTEYKCHYQELLNDHDLP